MSTKIKKDDRFICDMLGIKLRHNNIKYKYGKENKRMDCTTRAISRVLNLPYDDVQKMQFELGLKYNYMPNYIPIIEMILINYYGYTEIKAKRTYVGKFMYEHKTGRYVISAAGHMIAYINGTWYDNDHCLKYPDEFLVKRINKVYYKEK